MQQNSRIKINKRVSLVIVIVFHLLLLAGFARGQADTLVVNLTESGTGFSVFPVKDGIYRFYLTGCVGDFSLLNEFTDAFQEEGIICSRWNGTDNVIYLYRHENQSGEGLCDDVWNVVLTHRLHRRLLTQK